MNKRPVIAGIGELLWDVFPGGLCLFNTDRRLFAGSPSESGRHCRVCLHKKRSLASLS
ncbi:MAG: hypothetical protein LBU37_08365 [Tannerellaceae bacterium]|nr:hypothetical protein [Tannerellaceae bacterium]